MQKKPTATVLSEKSERIHTNAHPNSTSLIINEQACRKGPWNGGEGGGYQAMPQIYLNCAQWPVISTGPRRNMCTSEKRTDATEPLPVWYGSPIMAVSFTTQPCKTKLHEIDYPHTWTSFVTALFSPLCLCHRLSAGPCLFSRHWKINAPKMLAYEVMGY